MLKLLTLDQYKTQKMCDKVIFKDSFMLKYCLNRHKTHKMCDKAADAFLLTLTFVRDWFVTKKMIKNLDDAVLANNDIVFFYKYSSNVIFFWSLNVYS